MKTFHRSRGLVLRSAKREGGFTLIELLVVIGIIGILAALLLPAYIKARQHAKEGVTRAMIDQLKTACEAYQSDFGTYPMPTADRASTPQTSGLVLRLWTWPLSAGRTQPYFDFSPRNLDAAGNIVSPAGFEVFYEENASVRPKVATMRKPFGVDLWTASFDSVNPTNPSALKAESTVIGGW